jgi:hypothetical protein
MSTYYYAIDRDGDWIFDNFPTEAVHLIKDFKDSEKKVQIQIDKITLDYRIGRKLSKYGTVYTLTSDERYVRSLKLFKQLVDLSAISLKSIIDFKKQVESKQYDRTTEFTHNVTSQNSYSIQDLFALIPQDKLMGNINKQKEMVKEIINKKPSEASATLLRLIKYTLAMKVEFSVYERTIKPYVNVQKIEQPIRPVVLSVLQIFMQDFENNGIEISLDASDASNKILNIDNDSLFVSLYYILDNATKYCCPKTKFKIIFEEEETCFSILFKMVSIKIESREVSKLTLRGFRSDLAREVNKKGQGIGMYRLQKTLRLNNAELEIVPRYFDFPKKIGNINYEGNLFKIKFIGQQSWFVHRLK